ncbi:ABC transporter related protein OS=Tsukamurella paurometabola (strain ATCC 8368 / DSM / CCUG 35730 / CIP 100753 / JCM 10117 / KCTC 9821 / NBRC 16120 / NCIMB 702349 / NCTC 13040) OX=521096 GN=Tpau_0245 PE=4 SV=1 [Tsukamurella paurometabola]|uniref:ABC transporter related protein n=1 Tax=Tsukamurella paurometabola (strain ATCC 8368 / DSM 20162 / CCUG 35730 / CIP 100753 / JCM 10117 / KCTC 9821 / NBRC 16120 / NCIMB 702349 / NCTC 13040) TaxID=521096 RepID=D5UQR2_TSUPD|nr:ABC transporter related protein [Tsukamurella paurometabola DSM 20162]SUP42119.1 Lipoprotein-releasing system ATP-binding protein LolD [Tsukamurella paurometabola]
MPPKLEHIERWLLLKSVTYQVSPNVQSSGAAVLQICGLTYAAGHPSSTIVKDVNLTVRAGESVAVMGRSGSGKSSLLKLGGGLLQPTAGSVSVAGTRIDDLGEKGRALVRRGPVGFIFQGLNLIENLSVADNLDVAGRIRGRRYTSAEKTAALETVGLAAMGSRLVEDLSGGEAQRVAIARSLMSKPTIVFADEPTGALDSTNAANVTSLFKDVVAAGSAMVVATHDPIVAANTSRVVFLSDGRIVGELSSPSAEEIARRVIAL